MVHVLLLRLDDFLKASRVVAIQCELEQRYVFSNLCQAVELVKDRHVVHITLLGRLSRGQTESRRLMHQHKSVSRLPGSDRIKIASPT